MIKPFLMLGQWVVIVSAVASFTLGLMLGPILVSTPGLIDTSSEAVRKPLPQPFVGLDESSVCRTESTLLEPAHPLSKDLPMQRILITGCGLPTKALAMVLFPFPTFEAPLLINPPRSFSASVRDVQSGPETMESPFEAIATERTARGGVTTASTTNAPEH